MLEAQRFVQLGGAPEVGVYAAGPGLFHLANGRWTRIDLGTDVSFRDVEVVAEDDVWAVGGGGTVARRTARGWSVEQVPAGWELTNVAAWPGGAVATAAGNELWQHARGLWTSWSPDVLRDRWAGALWAAGPDAIFVAGQPQHLGSAPDLLRWDGATWSVHGTGRKGFVTAIHGASASEVWAVGYRPKLFGKGPLCLRWDGTTWADVDVPTRGGLVDVRVVGEDVWIAGRGGALLHGRGGRFTAEQVGRDDLTAVHASADGIVRVVVDGRRILAREPA